MRKQAPLTDLKLIQKSRLSVESSQMESLSVFGTAPRVPKDVIFSLIARYNDDQSHLKVNLGQGTYRDERGQPWVLPSVLEARSRISTSNLNHEYLPILGLPEFRRSACELALGSGPFGAIENRVCCVDALLAVLRFDIDRELPKLVRNRKPSSSGSIDQELQLLETTDLDSAANLVKPPPGLRIPWLRLP